MLPCFFAMYMKDRNISPIPCFDQVADMCIVADFRVSVQSGESLPAVLIIRPVFSGQHLLNLIGVVGCQYGVKWQRK